MILLSVVSGASALAQGTLQPILVNGPASNRVNLVVLSEGYTASQLAQFLVDATNAVNVLLAVPPYQEYRACFNAYGISVASRESGSDHPGWATNDTYFNSSYDGFLITIPPNRFDSNSSHGRGKVDALLQALMPECDQPILLVNDPFYGGSATAGGSGGRLLIASIHSDAQLILAHESGHTLAGLGDEYDDPNPGYPDAEEPNTTRETRREFIKWKAWMSAGTPVPTPATYEYMDAVGLFEGAHYHSTNWYRPKYECKMRNVYSPFCEVCSEALILSLYKKVRPVDGFSPPNTSAFLASSQAVTFSLNLVPPTTHRPVVQWLTNGVPVPGATNSALTLRPDQLGNGLQAVRAEVKDNTDLVRTDPAALLNQTVTWGRELHLGTLRWVSQDAVCFQLTGNAPSGFLIQGSPNLLDWTPLCTNLLSMGQFNYTNYEAAGFPYRFFRVLVRP